MKEHFLAVCASLGYKVNINERIIPGAGNTYKIVIRDKEENEIWSDYRTVGSETDFWRDVYAKLTEQSLTDLTRN